MQKPFLSKYLLTLELTTKFEYPAVILTQLQTSKKMYYSVCDLVEKYVKMNETQGTTQGCS